SGKTNFVAAGMTANEDRKKNVDFSDTYFDASQAIIVSKDSAIKSRTDLNGKKVGVQQGTTGDTYCTNEDGKNDIKVGSTERYAKGVDAITDLINGKIDAVVIDDFPAKKFVEKNSDKLVKLDEALTTEQYAIAVPKGDKAMLDTVNSVLGELKSSGELDKIIEKYKEALGA
ncbi:MAG: transporter substrate-binding domain-containing protein, partial [Ruminococcaceae bacterium]|nr:transporter substrate-binding domain-containing protein [Oscillospiraceae bacterium]